jgi:hypothetical protein
MILYKWKAPGVRNRNYLNYARVKHRLSNSMKNVKTARAADVESDYNLPVGNDRIRLEKIIKMQKEKSN